MKLIWLYRVGNFFYKKRIPILPRIFYFLIYFFCNSSVPVKCEIGNRSQFAYGGIGVVIHERTVIGDDCIIGQGITIGGKSKQYGVPVIGNRVYIGAGSRILGPIKIGNDVVIGANSVVIHDIPSNTVVAGSPAMFIKRCNEMKDFV